CSLGDGLVDRGVQGGADAVGGAARVAARGVVPGQRPVGALSAQPGAGSRSVVEPLHAGVLGAVFLGQDSGAALAAFYRLHGDRYAFCAGAASASWCGRCALRARLSATSASQYSLALLVSTSNSNRRVMSSVMSALST